MGAKLKLSDHWLDENIQSARKLFEYEVQSFSRESRSEALRQTNSEPRIPTQSDKK